MFYFRKCRLNWLRKISATLSFQMDENLVNRFIYFRGTFFGRLDHARPRLRLRVKVGERPRWRRQGRHKVGASRRLSIRPRDLWRHYESTHPFSRAKWVRVGIPKGSMRRPVALGRAGSISGRPGGRWKPPGAIYKHTASSPNASIRKKNDQ